ncbi:MAG TPA: alpha/beta hydrolase [Bryobacteraceae bacterium]|nr:alpha/beta hydrolase [Bryobacteraceae bacterium]
MTPERFTVPSSDGVPISVQRTGSGPAMLLVHGALLNGSLAWGLVTPKLSERFTVYTMDRRGRAPSGDTQTYSIANEADDISAVANAVGGPVIVISHSYGALASVAALDQLKNVSHLILYEPPLTADGARPDSPAVLEKLDQALAANDREQIVMTFLRDQIRAPMDRVEAFKTSPIWPIILEIASTLPRESRAVNTWRPSPNLLAAWKTPTTVLLGSLSTGILRDAAYFLRDTISGCRLVTLEGQGHSAATDAPDYFVSKILEIAQ